jgi:bisanhydrobacterioruberin hydratase
MSLSIHQYKVLALTPANMLLTLLVLNFGFDWHKSLVWAQVAVFMFGYCIELLGTKTGIVFGEYRYLNNLGTKILETPLLMGANWVITVFCSLSFVKFVPSKNIILKSVIATVIMVGLDLLIEPVSENLGFWAWNLGHAPFQNYIAWFLFGFLINYLILKFVNLSNNWLGMWLYLLQFLFFVTANISL